MNNLALLGYFGIIFAALGIIFLLSILPKQYREAQIKDGIKKVRLALPIINIWLIFVFSYAVWSAIDNVFIEQKPITLEASLYRFIIGSGLGSVGTGFLVIYRWGGSLFTEDR